MFKQSQKKGRKASDEQCFETLEEEHEQLQESYSKLEREHADVFADLEVSNRNGVALAEWKKEAHEINRELRAELSEQEAQLAAGLDDQQLLSRLEVALSRCERDMEAEGLHTESDVGASGVASPSFPPGPSSSREGATEVTAERACVEELGDELRELEQVVGEGACRTFASSLEVTRQQHLQLREEWKRTVAEASGVLGEEACISYKEAPRHRESEALLLEELRQCELTAELDERASEEIRDCTLRAKYEREEVAHELSLAAEKCQALELRLAEAEAEALAEAEAEAAALQAEARRLEATAEEEEEAAAAPDGHAGGLVAGIRAACELRRVIRWGHPGAATPEAALSSENACLEQDVSELAQMLADLQGAVKCYVADKAD